MPQVLAEQAEQAAAEAAELKAAHAAATAAREGITRETHEAALDVLHADHEDALQEAEARHQQVKTDYR